MTNDRALVRETKALIKEVQAGNPARAAWVAIQDRVKRLYEGRTQREVGDLLGERDQWVSAVLAWNPARDGTPFSRETAEQKGRGTVEAKKVLRDPEQRRRVIEDLTPAERSEVVKDISRSTTPESTSDESVELPDLDEAVAADLTAQVAKLVHTASRIDVLLAEHDAIFKRIDPDKAARLDDELERAVKTIRAVRAELLKHREIEVQA